MAKKKVAAAPLAAKAVKVSEAKGRPMLSWVGKRPLGVVKAFPAQQVERFSAPNTAAPSWDDWPASYPEGGLLFHGDNKEVLAHLLANGFRGKVQLIYIDPPFDSGANYVRQVNLRGPKGTAKFGGEAYSLGEQIQYTDIWASDNYLQFMYERLLLLKELLSSDGSIYLHCDWRRSHFLRILLDEVFGPENCQNEVVWKRTFARSDSQTFNHIHDVIFFYSKSENIRFTQLFTPTDAEYVERYYAYQDEDGRRFATINPTQAGLRNGPTGLPWRGFSPGSRGNHWKFQPAELDRLDAKGRIYWPTKEDGWPRLKSYLDELKGTAIQSIWTDLKTVNSQAAEREEYPTQKPEALLDRIINASSHRDDVVLDCFIGSGTTAAVAQKLGRRWIGCDINKGAIQTTAKRLQGIMEAQAEAAKPAAQQSLIEKSNDDAPSAQLSFTTWRVNNYDLQVQHLEAQALACSYLGVERSKTDSFFDGTLGKALVKFIGFDHPLSPEDLELLRAELDARKEEDRAIKVVCLGMELAAQAWLDEWNRLRKGNATANRIDVIELRDDPTHGGWMNYTPAEARVSIARKKDRIVVAVENFISPTIVARLKQQAGVLTPRIDDFRSMIDSVAIDTAYDGAVFNVVEVDIPEKKTDLVLARYDLPAPKRETKVAVRITDMLGEEVLVVRAI